ncbi:MAG: Rrf2 family transcriptional regulator [Chitinophagales bacterium]
MALNGSSNKPVGLSATATSQNIPSHFLGKIMQQLVKKQVLSSIKGPNGGFYLAKPADKIRIIEIFDIFDGIESLEKCVLGFDACSSIRPCPLHDSYMRLKKQLLNYYKENH